MFNLFLAVTNCRSYLKAATQTKSIVNIVLNILEKFANVDTDFPARVSRLYPGYILTLVKSVVPVLTGVSAAVIVDVSATVPSMIGRF